MFSFRKVLLSTAVFVLVFGFYTGAVHAETSGRTGVITGSIVNLRQTSSTTATILMELPKGTQVSVLTGSGDWYKVSYKGKTGWVHSDYLTVKSGSAASTASGKTGVITGSVVNLRSTASTSGKILAELPKGTQVSILSSSGGWYKVSYKSKTGWVIDDYLAVKSAQTTSRSDSAATTASGKTGVITGSVVNLRSTASTSGKILAELPKGTQVSILSSSGGWYKVSSKSKTGWVIDDYLAVGKASATTGSVSGTGIVTASVLNIRSSPSTSAKLIHQYEKGAKVTILSSSGSWYKLRLSSSASGWASADYVKMQAATASRGGETERENATLSSGASTKGEQIVAYAKKFLGVPYVWGGTSPNGFDCSGLVYYVYKHFGITLERVADQQSRQGTAVSKSELRPGDLVFADTSGSNNGDITHVGIYIGDGKFIHAPNPSSSVKITDLTSGYYAGAYVKARRIIN